jgi:hypothetical protein
MRKRILLCAVALGLAGGGSDFVVKAADPRPPCCFTNAQYSGVCQIEPAEKETCASILDYLNTPNSMGKSYCHNSTVRGGWKQETCAQPTPAPQGAGAASRP